MNRPQFERRILVLFLLSSSLIAAGCGADVVTTPPPSQPPPPQPTYTGTPQPAAPAPSEAAPSVTVAETQPAPPQPQVPAGDPWVVLSNLRYDQFSPNKAYTVDYRWVQGGPQSGAQYNLVIEETGGGALTSYAEQPVNLAAQNGTLTLNVFGGVGFTGGGLKAYLATGPVNNSGGAQPPKISGELKSGQAESSATPAPPPQVPVAAAGSGPSVGLANATTESNNFGEKVFRVDAVGQNLPIDGRFFLIITGSGGEAMEIDVSHELRRGGGTQTLGGRALGRGPSGPYEMHVEMERFTERGQRTTISNSVTAN